MGHRQVGIGLKVVILVSVLRTREDSFGDAVRALVHTRWDDNSHQLRAIHYPHGFPVRTVEEEEKTGGEDRLLRFERARFGIELQNCVSMFGSSLSGRNQCLLKGGRPQKLGDMNQGSALLNMAIGFYTVKPSISMQTGCICPLNLTKFGPLRKSLPQWPLCNLRPCNRHWTPCNPATGPHW